MESNMFFLVSLCILLLSLGLGHIHADKPSARDLIGTRKGNTVRGLSHLKNYLSKLGYMNSNNKSQLGHADDDDDSFDDNLEKAVRDYQTFFGLRVTGVLDAATVAMMSRPRCGFPDLTKATLRQPQGDYHSLYEILRWRWPPGKRSLTYSFAANTRPDAYTAISNATSLWASVSPFRFTYIPEYDKADIKISFQYRDHGDGSPFDGTGGILAHGFLPTDGRLHFDEDERWAHGVVRGSYDIQTVGLHELGHILGLGHSSVAGALMYPYIDSGIRKLLGKDDIDGIREMYPS